MGKKNKKKKPFQQTNIRKKSNKLTVVNASNAHFGLLLSSNPNPRSIGPFNQDDTILVVGDGDFSFSRALTLKLDPSRIVSTSYDSKREVLEKYERAIGMLSSLYETRIHIRHSIDCQLLHTYDWNGKVFNKVVFNFPHVGGSKTEDIKINQNLLLCFFYSCRLLLKGNSQVILSLRDTSFYRKWKVVNLAKICGFPLKEERDFNASEYVGYEAQRTNPATRQAPEVHNARMYVFERRDMSSEEESELKAQIEEIQQKNNRYHKGNSKNDLLAFVKEAQKGKTRGGFEEEESSGSDEGGEDDDGGEGQSSAFSYQKQTKRKGMMEPQVSQGNNNKKKNKKKNKGEGDNSNNSSDNVQTNKERKQKYKNSAFICQKCNEEFKDRKKYDKHINLKLCSK